MIRRSIGIAGLLGALSIAASAQNAAPADSPPTPPPTEPGALGTPAQPAEAPITAPSRPSVIVPTEEKPSETGGLSFRLAGGFAHAFESNLDSAGSVSASRAALEFSLSGALTKTARLAVNINSEASFYDFKNATALIPGTGDPWDDLYSVSVGPTLSVGVDDNWSWFVGMDVRFSGEPDADVGDSMTYGGVAGARYAFSKDFAFTFGAFGTSRLEDDPLILPLIGVEWKINDRVRLATRGTGLAITATISETVECSILGAWNSRDFRLEEGRALNPNGVVRDERIPIGVELAWTPTPAVRVAFEAGVVAWQEYEVFDSNGNDVSDDNTDPAAYVGISVSVRF